ncbi:glycosyltransferase family 4 protein [Crocinitomicaceae bacterium CZZ-1]|uniref:Glycosyltransferase family 4 protein n=1 Tax=Taishania pollutisoli TaxID=2766479 RepID=A0A8J6TZQ5_9FLAO|nr:glycosyltransferase [Taishania pollutisoli]MBC9812413.1 glycosyltransferase family 4 protein [Taishania pollutisoli]
MKILIIGKVWPEPDSSAAGRRMKQLIALLQYRGEVHFACANALTGNEIDLGSMGVVVQQITLNDDAVNVYFRELNPDLVVFDRFLTEEQYGWRIIEQCPDAIRVLNTEDLHFLRKTRQKFVKTTNSIATDTTVLDFQNEETMRELASIYRSDLTLMISPFEMELLQQEMQVPGELLMYLPLFTEYKTENTTSFQERKDFLFIGNTLHEPNADAIRMLVEHIWPELRKECPAAELIIAGAYPSQHILQLDSEKNRIKVVGHVKDLDELYKTVRVSLIPLRYGAGIKGKIVETLEYGVPFVSTSVGTEGMFFGADWEECIADDWTSFVQKAISQYCDMTKWENYQKMRKQHLQTHFARSLFEQNFLDQLDNLTKTIHAKRKKRYFSSLVQHHSLMSTRYLSKWIMEKNNKNVE